MIGRVPGRLPRRGRACPARWCNVSGSLRKVSGDLRPQPPQRSGQVLIPAGDVSGVAQAGLTVRGQCRRQKRRSAAQVGRGDVRPVQDGPARERQLPPLTVQAAPMAAKPAAQAKRLANRLS